MTLNLRHQEIEQLIRRHHRSERVAMREDQFGGTIAQPEYLEEAGRNDKVPLLGRGAKKVPQVERICPKHLSLRRWIGNGAAVIEVVGLEIGIRQRLLAQPVDVQVVELE